MGRFYAIVCHSHAQIGYLPKCFKYQHMVSHAPLMRDTNKVMCICTIARLQWAVDYLYLHCHGN